MMNLVDEPDMLCKLHIYTLGSTRNIQNHPYKRVHLLFYGMFTHGKSALIKSCLRVMEAGDGLIESETLPGNRNDPNTEDIKGYKLSNNVYIAGIQDFSTSKEEALLEMALQFCQIQIPRDERWDKGPVMSARSLITNSKHINPEIIVPIFVYSAESASAYTSDRLAEIDPFIREAWNITDIFPIIVITRYRDSDEENIEYIFQELGANYVFFIKDNTEAEPAENETERDRKILRFLDTCLQEADRGIEMKLGKKPEEEFKKQAERLKRKEVQLEEQMESKWKENLNNGRPIPLIKERFKEMDMEQENISERTCVIG